MRPGTSKGITVVTMRGRLSWIFLGLGVLTCLAYLVLRAGSAEPAAYLVAASVGVVMSILGACLMHGPRRKVWVALAAGQVLYFAGDVTWVIYEQVLHIAPYPSVADAFYLARYPLLVFGLMWLIRGRRHGRDRAALLDAAIISTGFAVLGGVFVIAPAAAGGGTTLLSQVVAGAYPVGDLLLLAALVRLFTSGAARNVSFWSLVGGLAITMVVDIQYVLSVVSGVWFPPWVNVGWLVGYLLIGFSGPARLCRPPLRPRSGPAGTRDISAVGRARACTCPGPAHRAPREVDRCRREFVHRGFGRTRRHSARARPDGWTAQSTPDPGSPARGSRAKRRVDRCPEPAHLGPRAVSRVRDSQGERRGRSPSRCWTWTTSRHSTTPTDT